MLNKGKKKTCIVWLELISIILLGEYQLPYTRELFMSKCVLVTKDEWNYWRVHEKKIDNGSGK